MTLEELQAALAAGNQDIKTLLAEQQKEIKTLGETTGRTAKELLTAQAQVKAISEELAGSEQRRIELEAKIGRLGYAADTTPQTLGQRFVASEGYKAYQGTKNLQALVADLKWDRKALTTASTGSLTNLLGSTYQIPGIVAAPERPTHIRDLMNVVTTDAEVVHYVVETGFTNAAAGVAESGTLPETSITAVKRQSLAQKIGHFTAVTEEAVADVAQLQTHIDRRLVYGVMLEEDRQLLYGDGSGELTGIKLTASVQTYSWSEGLATDTKLDAIRRAITLSMVANYPVDGCVMNPTDWEDIELLKDSNERYIWGTVGEGAALRVWRVPVVVTNAISSGEAVIGAFSMGADLYDLASINVQITNSHGTNFTKDVLVMKGTERVIFPITRPEAFVWITFDAPGSGS